MKQFNSKKIGTLFFLATLTLTPLIWFYGKGTAFINGVDTNFPLDPIAWFLRRFYVWYSTSNAGSDFASSTAGLFFHSIQVFPYVLGASLQITQIISFIFWFGCIVLGSFFLARLISPKSIPAQLVFVIFYTFNIYLFNTWENVKVANLSLVAALPLFLAILISFSKKFINWRTALFYSMLASFVASGTGINPAYFLVLTGGLFLYTLIMTLLEREREPVIYLWKSFAMIFTVLILVNSFWIFSTVYSMFFSEKAIRILSDIGFTDWLDSLSQNTSLLNIFRLQGAWDWYAFDQTSGLPLYISYSLNYLFDLPFLLFSFALPAIIFISLIFRADERKNFYPVFGAFFILGVFLGAGSHEPTGLLYTFLDKHLPFFSFFRSPWYIFSPFTTLAMAGLISLLVYKLETVFLFIKIKKARPLFILFVAALIAGNLIYNYPLVTGRIFRSEQNDSFFVKFPDYILESQKWLNGNKDGRIIGYPDDEIEYFHWGYRGVESILGLIVDREVLFSPLNLPNSDVAVLIKEFYTSLKKGENVAAYSLAAKLNISSILEKKDQPSLAPNLNSGITGLPSKIFGSWNFYDLSGKGFLPKIYSSSSLVFGSPYKSSSLAIPALDGPTVLLNPRDNVIMDISGFASVIGEVVVAENSQVKDLINFERGPSLLVNRLLHRDLSKVEFNVQMNRSGNYQPVLEKYRLDRFEINLEKELEVSLDGKNTSWKIDRITDSYVYFKAINISNGLHTVVLDLKGKNVALKADLDKDQFEKEGIGDFQIINDGNRYLSMFNKSQKDIFANFYLNNFDNLSTYMIQFKYRQIYGNNATVLVAQKNDRSLVKTEVERMPNYPEWNNFSFYYHPVNTASNLRIALDAPSTKDPLGTKVLYSDLEVIELFSNRLLFLENSDPIFFGSPSISFDKKSPVLYEGVVSGTNKPHVIIFSENYSDQWELSLYKTNGEKIEVKPPHFSANLFANAWYIDVMPEEYRIEIFYRPQKIYIFGLAISIVSVLLIIIVKLWSLKGKIWKE